MPIYDFACSKCEHKFDLMFSTYAQYEEQKKKMKCPSCKSKRVEKQMSTNVTANFVGPGFYVNDYKKRGK